MPTLLNQPADAILSNPHYQQLVKTRRRLSVVLSLVMLASYVSFILLIAFKPTLLGTPIAAGSPITIGIPLGLGLILLAMVLTGVYVHLSNTVFDALTEQARKALGKK
jgi:uncharacterized membrane protein (DUF485 family)